MKGKYYIIFSIIWMIFIFILSSQSSEKFQEISYSIKWLKFQSFIAHFTLYFILGFFYMNFLHLYVKNKIKKILYYFLLIIFYSIFDEVHQYFVPGRFFEIIDILFNIIGATTLVIIFLSKKRSNSIVNKNK
ncbi:MAG: hypothetical protein CL746_01170 [Chloroflexi bacterium]|nr:hypothetical protein [Chloroflexota bacterium]|tara:strand:+ start:5499 stop:5894 length:396 start_codon:yes stop_codon:yes gene_type:complete